MMQTPFSSQIGRLTLLCCAFVTALCSLSGCSSTGYQKGDVAAISMQRAAGEVQAEGRAMDQTMATLRDLVDQPQGDLRIPYKRYSKSLDRLIASAERIENTGKKMKEKNAAYVAEWDRQLQTIDYGHIHELSETRRNEVTNHVDAVERRYEESQEAMVPLITYLMDIRRALSTDLTSAGLESMKPVVQNANDNAVKVQTALDALTAELTNSSAGLSSVAYQAKPQEAPIQQQQQ